MTPIWLKQLYKAADLIFQVKPEFNYWSKHEFEPLTVAIFFPSSRFILGNAGRHPKCFPWQGRCAKYHKHRTWTDGIFCANFSFKRKNFPTCHQIWCGECYTSPILLVFPIRLMRHHFNDNDPTTKERLVSAWGPIHQSSMAYMHARNGDHT